MPEELETDEEDTPEVILTGEALAKSERRRRRREATQDLLSWGLGGSEDDDDTNTDQLLQFFVEEWENEEERNQAASGACGKQGSQGERDGCGEKEAKARVIKRSMKEKNEVTGSLFSDKGFRRYYGV